MHYRISEGQYINHKGLVGKSNKRGNYVTKQFLYRNNNLKF